MHVVMRSHPNTEVADILVRHKGEIKKLIRGVPGFVSWTLIRTGDTCMTATICQDKSGCDQSMKVAREWLSKNAPNTLSSMQVQEGEVLLRLT
jgi:hypothetical protein